MDRGARMGGACLRASLGEQRLCALSILPGLFLRDRAARLEHPDGLQRADLARTWSVLCDRRIHHGDFDRAMGHLLRMEAPGFPRTLLRGRPSLRTAGA